MEKWLKPVTSVLTHAAHESVTVLVHPLANQAARAYMGVTQYFEHSSSLKGICGCDSKSAHALKYRCMRV